MVLHVGGQCTVPYMKNHTADREKQPHSRLTKRRLAILRSFAACHPALLTIVVHRPGKLPRNGYLTQHQKNHAENACYPSITKSSRGLVGSLGGHRWCIWIFGIGIAKAWDVGVCLMFLFYSAFVSWRIQFLNHRYRHIVGLSVKRRFL